MQIVLNSKFFNTLSESELAAKARELGFDGIDPSLFFDDDGLLKDFVSDDRFASADGKEYTFVVDVPPQFQQDVAKNLQPTVQIVSDATAFGGGDPLELDIQTTILTGSATILKLGDAIKDVLLGGSEAVGQRVKRARKKLGGSSPCQTCHRWVSPRLSEEVSFKNSPEEGDDGQ